MGSFHLGKGCWLLELHDFYVSRRKEEEEKEGEEELWVHVRNSRKLRSRKKRSENVVMWVCM